MDLLHIIILALVQGFTEFLPVSSSAHLILVPIITNWQDQSLSFDIAVHVGTLIAVIAYFQKDLRSIIYDWCASNIGKGHTSNSRLGWAMIIGTIPLGITGLLGKSFVETQLRSPLVIAVATIVFGLALWAASAHAKKHTARHNTTEFELSWLDIIVIGCAQAIALIPGTSRSGITMTAGLLRGLSATTSARFSFLLSIPAIGAAGSLLILDVIKGNAAIQWESLMLGAILSCLSAFACIHFFLKLLERIGLMPFVIYRLLLGGILLVVFI